MRGRAVVLILSVLFVSRLTAQCGYTLRDSVEFRASYLDVAADGNDLWTATGYGVQLLDRSTDPPALIDSLPIPGTTRAVRIGGNGIVFVASGTRVYAVHKTNGAIAIVGSIDTGATVNDLVASSLFIYAATSAGVLQYNVLNPAAPFRTAATMPTSSPNVTSLALLGSTLYAADGDSTVEIFSVNVASFPEQTGTVTSLPHSIAVRATSGRLYVSDGFTTDAFTFTPGSNYYVKATNVAIGATAFATLPDDTIAFMAGTDRRIHALDWRTAGSPVELFASDVVPSGGNINRPVALAVAGDRLYVAGGDTGLETFDVSSFEAPIPVRSYGGAPTQSTLWIDNSSGVYAGMNLYAALSAGGIEEFRKDGNGYLTAGRQWDTAVHTLWDGGNGFLLSSTGSLLTFWTLTSTTPTIVSSATFPATVAGAALFGSKALVILADRSIWSADLSQNPATITAFASTLLQPSPLAATAIAHSGDGVVFANVRDDGSTDLTFFSSPQLNSPPITASFPGATITGVTLSGTTAAIFTFNGITLYDFAAGTASIIPQSSGALARQLVLSGSRIFELTDTSLVVWDATTRTKVRTLALPDEGDSLSVDALAGIATPHGVMTAAFDASSQLPQLVATQNPNTYYKKVLAAGDRLYLYDGRSVDIFSTTVGLTPHFIASVKQQGLVDFAVTPLRLFTLTSGGAIAAYSRDGVALNQVALSEGSDVQPLAMATAGGALWVGIARGCLSGGCEKKTIVFDGTTLVRTTSLDGAVVDTVSSSGGTWSIFDLPAQIRLYDTSTDADHPALLASTAASGTKTPVSLALAGASLYVVGDKLYIYPAATLASHTEALNTYQADPAGAFAYVDQRIRTDGACTLIAGRAFSPQFYTSAQWGSATIVEVPAAVRSVAQTPGRIYLLTDDSLEVLAVDSGPGAPRHRSVR